MEMTTLWQMAVETEAAVPAVLYTTKKKFEESRGRHYEAVRIIEKGQLHFWGLLPSGAHRFQMRGHETVYEMNFCDCWDHGGGAPEHEGFYLCKHILAARYWLANRVQIQAQLRRLISEAVEQNLDHVMLESRVWFVYNERLKGGVQENELVAYRLGKNPKVELDEDLRFYNGDLHEALYSLDWMVKEGRVGGAFMGARERWFLGPAPESYHEPNMQPADRTRIWRLDGQSPESRERKRRELISMKMWEETLLAPIPEIPASAGTGAGGKEMMAHA